MPRYKDSEDWVKQGSKRVNPVKAKPYNTEFAEVAEHLSATGATEMDIAYILGTTVYGLKQWKRKHPEFAKSLNRGKQLTRAYLIAKGIKAAAGFNYIEEKRDYKVDKDGNQIGDVKISVSKKSQAPDGKLLMFMIAALDRQLGGDNWVSKQFIESKSEKNVNVRVIDGKKIAEQFDKLSGKWSKAIDGEVVDAEFVDSDSKERNNESI